MWVPRLSFSVTHTKSFHFSISFFDLATFSVTLCDVSCEFSLGQCCKLKKIFFFFFMIRRQMGHFQWCPWWRLGRWRWWWWWMRAEGNLEASRYVPCAPAVVEQKGCACPLLVAMPSIATFLIDLLAFAHSHQRPVIALDAIFSPLSPYYSLIIIIEKKLRVIFS